MDFVRNRRLDVALVVLTVVVLASALMGSGGSTKVGGIVGAVALLVLLARRWQPLAASVLSFAGLMVAAQVSPKASGAEFFAVLAVFGVAGSLQTRRDAVIAWIVGCLTFGTAMSRNPNVGGAGDIALTLAFCSVVWGAGLLAAERGRAMAAAHHRAEGLEAERDEHVREATEHERARIATELHDIVSHGLSVVVVQTVAARMAIEDAAPPDQIDGRLAAVESVARDALADMRRLLGLLQSDDAPAAGTRTSPTVAQLPALIAQLQRAGMKTELDLETPLTLPAGLDAAVYRIVQEALTNVIKHADGANARVEIGRERGDLVITVANPVPTSVDALPGAGRGLIGMRQRAELYGGTVDARRNDDGFQVLVRIPLPTEDRPRTFTLRGRRRTL